MTHSENAYKARWVLPSFAATFITVFLACSTTTFASSTTHKTGPKPVPPGKVRYFVVLNLNEKQPIDFKGLGADVEDEWRDRVQVALPEKAVEQLRRHKRVKYVQRVLPPGTRSPFLELLETMPETEVMTSQARIDVNSTGSWTTGNYTYDGSGNVVQIGVNSDLRTNYYVYDRAQRLVEASAHTRSKLNVEKFSYDAFGNMTSRETNGSLLTIPVNVASNRISGAFGAAYDAAGNMKAYLTDRYDYDAVHMMRSVDYGIASQDFHVYTADDERIGTFNNGQNLWRWTIRGLDHKVLRQYESFGENWVWMWIEDYVYSGPTLVNSEREAAEGGARHYHVDHLGSPRLVTTASGGERARYDYFAFGEEATPITQDFAAGDDHENRMKFTGHERDYLGGNSTDNKNYLDYMHARYYSPAMGRFLSVDPVLDMKQAVVRPQMWNRYSYVTNNPIIKSDPDGRVENVQQPGFTKPLSEADDWSEHPSVSWAFYAQGGLLSAAGGGAGYSALNRLALNVMLRLATWGGGTAASAEALRRAAAGGGPTTTIVTNLTRAPQEGRVLHAASGEGAQAVANAARSGAGVRTFVAQVPQALLKGLEQANLVQVSRLVQKGSDKVVTEYKFLPGATEYILKFFKEVK